MAANEGDPIGEEKYNAILNKTKKLSEKLQGIKRTAFPSTRKEPVKRIKLANDVKQEGRPKKPQEKSDKQPSKQGKDGKNFDKSNKKPNKDKFLEEKEAFHVKFENGEKIDWKKYKQHKKELKAHRRGKKAQPAFVKAAEDAKHVWIEMMMKSTPKSKHEELARKMWILLSGSVLQVAKKRDTSRFVQGMIIKGDAEIRNRVFEAFKDNLFECARNLYAHHCILSMLKYGNKEQIHLIIKSFDGNVLKLMNDSVGCKVLEEAFNEHASALERARIMQEFYAPEYVSTKNDEIKSLKDALDKNPDRKTEILTRVSTLVNKGIEKNRWRIPMFHVMLWEYLSHAEPNEKVELLETSQEHLLEILHTKEGSRVAMLALFEGNKKARKSIVKSFKGKVSEICKEEHGYRVLLALFDCVDDTVLVSKAIIGEISTNLKDIMSTDVGRKVVLYILAPRNKRFFDADTIQLLASADGNPNTKKDLSLIHSELRTAILPGLLAYLAENVQLYLQNNKLALFLETLLSHIPDKSLIYEAIATGLAKFDRSAFDKAGYALKCVIRLMTSDDCSSSANLATAILEKLSADVLTQLADGHEKFILALVCKGEKTAANYGAVVKCAKKVIKKLGEDSSKKIAASLYLDQENVDASYKKLLQVVG